MNTLHSNSGWAWFISLRARHELFSNVGTRRHHLTHASVMAKFALHKTDPRYGVERTVFWSEGFQEAPLQVVGSKDIWGCTFVGRSQ